MGHKQGKGARLKARRRREAQKRERRNSNQAFYDSIKGTPANIKRKNKENKKKFNTMRHSHIVFKCGNVGCMKHGIFGCIIKRNNNAS